MALRLNGQTTGYTELNAPANGDSVILTMPGNDGTSGQYLQTDGSGTLSWQTVTDTDTNTFGFTSLGEFATTSGSGTTATGIPSDATEIIMILTDVSVNSTSVPHLILQMGNGSIDGGNNYRYTAFASTTNNANGGHPWIGLTTNNYTAASNVYSGIIRIIPGTSNIQGRSIIHYHGGFPISGTHVYYGGTTIDRVMLTSASTFDGGKFEVLHNGTP